MEEYTRTQIEHIVLQNHLEDKTAFVDGGHNTLYLGLEEFLDASKDYLAAKDAGVNVSVDHWLTKSQMQDQYGTPHPGRRGKGHNIWPIKFVTELFKLANSSANLDLNLRTLTPATAITANDDSAYPWIIQTARGPVTCSRVVHATNAYASHLLPQFAGPKGIIPTRGQVAAVRANASFSDLSTSSWDISDGYWHPVMFGNQSAPLVIIGGGRGDSEEQYLTDDSTINSTIGQRILNLLPPLFPEKFETAPEMEWVRLSGLLVCLLFTSSRLVSWVILL